MKVRIQAEGHRFFIPVPLSLGSLAIRCIGKKYMSKQDKKLVLTIFKSIRKELKAYKGLTIVEVDAASGEHISIKI